MNKYAARIDRMLEAAKQSCGVRVISQSKRETWEQVQARAAADDHPGLTILVRRFSEDLESA